MITTNVLLRDPFVLVDGENYYVYGTGSSKHSTEAVGYVETVWACYKNTSGKLDGEWTRVEGLYEVPASAAETPFWAPEVHRYGDSFYLIATYRNKETNHRGCGILRAASPEGPFVEISDGHITPSDWDAIDGTLYVDPDGQPWLVFVHEWTCTPDGVGTFAAAKLSEDLSHFISDPVELFRATDPVWAKGKITDGCFLYTTKEGKLLMIWSNMDANGYAVGIAHSKSGKVDCTEWIHEPELLFSKSLLGQYDGGHGMLFRDTDGQMYLSIHSPNTPKLGRPETATFVPVVEENGSLRCIFD